MEENTIRRRLLRLSVIVCAVGAVLLIGGAGIISSVARYAHEDVHTRIKTEAQEYKNRIFKQFDKDFETLHTLAVLLSKSPVLSFDKDNLMNWIAAANNEYNNFVGMAYFTSDGKGMMNPSGKETILDYPLASCDEAVQEAVERSFAGENVISRFFLSEITKKEIYIYSVPVYQEGEIAGVLAASTHLDIFQEIANGEAVMSGNGFIHVISSDGTFLVRSPNSLVPYINEYTTIFDGPYISSQDQKNALELMENQQGGFFEFRYENKSYHFYLQPLNINGWYLMCVDTMWGGVSYSRQISLLMGISFFLMLLLSCFLLAYGYFLIRKHYHKMYTLAYYDQVTGAQNFAYFQQRLSAYQKQSKKYSVIAFNMRNFKFINELFGTKDGNLVLNYLSSQFASHMKEKEFYCRETADQFYLFFKDTDPKQISARLHEIISSIRAGARKRSDGFDLNLYCGVAIGGDPHQALLAQQHIRQNVNTRIHFYDEDIHKQELQVHYMESHMEQALENGEFKLYLQPKIRLSDGTAAGAEALVRWHTEDGTFFFPGEFIPLFETNGFCVRLDLYMVEQACKQIRSWLDRGIAPIPISVNQSRLLFMEENYVDNLTKILEKYGVSPSLIVLEILEGMAAQNLSALNERIKQLHCAGFKVSMDDFGSGYSSLNTLSQLTLDELKIDQSFLRGIAQENDEKRWTILKQIVLLAQKLNITTVVEGIETQENAQRMAEFGCEYGQGYFYSKPICAQEFSEKYMK